MVAFKDRTGERFKNRDDLGGYEFVIVEYNKRSDVWVEFQDEHKARVHTQYGNCEIGNVKNPYHPSVYGVGYLGLMKDGSRVKTGEGNKRYREYGVWLNMFVRCYGDYEKHYSYKDAIVCERWHCYANFLEDLPLIEGYQFWLEHPNEQIALDKDIKGNGSKVYCLENCCFVTNSDNSKEVHERFDLNKTSVVGIHKITKERVEFETIKEAGEFANIHPSMVGKCCKGIKKSGGGYYWFYKKDLENNE